MEKLKIAVDPRVACCGIPAGRQWVGGPESSQSQAGMAQETTGQVSEGGWLPTASHVGGG